MTPSHLFEDESVDFIYLDAYAHTGQENGRLIDLWWRKLNGGGLFAGHDYDPKWPQTVEAVDDVLPTQGTEGQCGSRSSDRQSSGFLRELVCLQD